MRLFKRFVARWAGEESGAVAPLIALAMVVLLGSAALAVDAGVLYVQRNQLQNAVDAAALAAAQDIGTGNPCARALQYAQANALAAPGGCPPGTGGEIIANQAASVYAANDAWTVTAERQQNPIFARFLGLSAAVPVRASATALKSPAAAAPVIPFAIWGGNPPGDPYSLTGTLNPANELTYRDNQWYRTVVVYPYPNPCGGKNQPQCHWGAGNSSTFKGFLHVSNDVAVIGGSTASADSGGGGSNEHDDRQSLCSVYLAHPSNPVALFPVLDWSVSSSGQIAFTITGLRAIVLEPNGGCSSPGDQFTGNTLKGHPSPNQDYVVQGEGGGGGIATNVYVLKLWR